MSKSNVPIFWFEKEFQMAGLNRSGYPKERLEVGHSVRLVRQPENPYDKNAISIQDYAGAHIAFVPREIAAVLAPRMDLRKYPFKAKLTQVQAKDDPDLTLWGVHLEFYRYPEDLPPSAP